MIIAIELQVQNDRFQSTEEANVSKDFSLFEKCAHKNDVVTLPRIENIKVYLVVYLGQYWKD